MESSEIIFSCLDHVEIAIEEIINEYEKSPELIENITEKCSYCDKTSKYEVK